MFIETSDLEIAIRGGLEVTQWGALEHTAILCPARTKGLQERREAETYAERLQPEQRPEIVEAEAGSDTESNRNLGQEAWGKETELDLTGMGEWVCEGGERGGGGERERRVAGGHN